MSNLPNDFGKKEGGKVNLHGACLVEVHNEGELEKDSTISKIETVQKEGKRQVSREVLHYNPFRKVCNPVLMFI